MKDNLMVRSLGFIILFLFGTVGFSQKLKSDGYKIAIQKNAEKKQMRMHGKTYITFKGSVKINSKDSLKGTYQFVYLDLGNGIGNLSFKNSKKQTLPPKLLFEEKKGIFSYNNKKGEEGTMKATAYMPLEDVVLKGMLLWVKIKQELPLN